MLVTWQVVASALDFFENGHFSSERMQVGSVILFENETFFKTTVDKVNTALSTLHFVTTHHNIWVQKLHLAIKNIFFLFFVLQS